MEGWVDVRVDGETITVPQHGGLPSMPGDGKPALPYDQPIPYKPTKKSARTEKNPDADRQMKIAESILGTYRLPSSIAPGDELIHIGSEGRFVHFMYMSAAAKRMQAIAFWAERVDDDHYRTRPKPDNRWGVVSRWVPTPTGMRIERAEIAFELTRMDESELPGWYAESLAKALEKMSKREEELEKRSDGPGT
jgi:hypothetical protein